MRKIIIAIVVSFCLPSVALAQLAVPAGGTGTTTFPTNYVLVGQNALRVTAVATSSLGLQVPIILTTSGSSGASTFNGTTLNIPQYSGGGGGSVGNWFAPFANYNATSTPLGFLQGFFSTASSTLNANLFLTNLSQGLLFNGTNGLTQTVATSTLTPSGPLTGSFTRIGSGGSVGIQAASASQNGYLSNLDYSLLHTATSTFTSPLIYTLGTNAVTLDTSGAWSGNAGTATALAANGTNCSAGNYALGVDASGNAEGCTLAYASGYPFVAGTTYNTSAQGTSSPLWLQGSPYSLFASSTSVFSNATSSLQTISSTLWLSALGTPAGAFLAVDPNGKVISTSTPSGSNSAYSIPANYASTTTLPAYTYSLGVITATGNGALYIDGNNPTVGQRILVKNESGACTSSSGGCNNGLYGVTAAGSAIAAFVLTRDPTYNSSSNIIPGEITYVVSGTSDLLGGNADDLFALTSAAPITVGTTALNYVEVSGGGSSVTSVAASVPSFLSISGSPITTSGTLAISYSGTALPVANGGTGATALTGDHFLYTNHAGTAVLTAASSSLNLPNSALANSSVTVNTSGPLGGGGSVSLGGAALTLTCSSCSTFAYPFVNVNDFGTSTAATTTLSFYTSGVYFASSTVTASQFPFASTTAISATTASTTNLTISNIPNALVLTSSGGIAGSYGGAAACTNQVVTAISATGGTTCTTVANAYLSNSSITITAGNGLTGGGSISLGSSATLALASALATSSAETVNYVPAWNTTSGAIAKLTGGDASFVHLPGAAVGVGTTTPWAMFSISTSTANTLAIPLFAIGSSTNATLFAINISGGVQLAASSTGATSTNMVLDWSRTPQQVEYQIGSSATTITLTNATTSQYFGSTKRVWICNPSTTAGALTWRGVEWIGTAPTQTTTTNQCDLYFFDITQGTSTALSNTPSYKVAGGANLGFQ